MNRKSQKYKEENNKDFGAQPDLLEINIGYNLIPLVEEAEDKKGPLVEEIQWLRNQLDDELGLVLPKVRIRDSSYLKPDEYALFLSGTEVIKSSVKLGHYLCLDTGSVSNPFLDTTKWEKTKDPAYGMDGFIISEKEVEKAREAGYVCVSPEEIIRVYLYEIIKKNRTKILDQCMVNQLTEKVRISNPDVFTNWHIMGGLSGCDVVLTNGNTHYVGLKYFADIYPYVVYKGYGLNTYQRKNLTVFGIPCIEYKPLTRSMFAEIKEGLQFTTNYLTPISKNLYEKLVKKLPKETEFEKQHKEDVLYHIYELEKNEYKKVLRNFRRRKHPEKKFEGSVTRYFEEEIRNLTADYKLNTRSNHNSVLKADEFYLKTCFDKYDIRFLQIVFLAETQQQIYIGSRNFFVSFDYAQSETAMEFVKLLIKTCNKELINDARLLCDEYDVNPKEYEIALNSIKTIVELNYKHTGQKYGIFSDTTSVSIALKKNDSNPKKPRMYNVVITYKEYLRNPEVFKEFIKNPKPQKQCNFWCREQKYKPELFEKNKQTITS